MSFPQLVQGVGPGEPVRLGGEQLTRDQRGAVKVVLAEQVADLLDRRFGWLVQREARVGCELVTARR